VLRDLAVGRTTVNEAAQLMRLTRGSGLLLSSSHRVPDRRGRLSGLCLFAAPAPREPVS